MEMRLDMGSNPIILHQSDNYTKRCFIFELKAFNYKEFISYTAVGWYEEIYKEICLKGGHI